MFCDFLTVQRSDAAIHPGLVAAPAPDAGVDPLEFFYWDLTGFLVVPGVMDTEWLAEANRAVEANLHRANYEQAAQGRVDGGPRMAGSGRPGVGDLHSLPPEDREVFYRTLGHPAIAARLNWMMGPGWRGSLGSLILTQQGGGGQGLHGAGEPVYPWINWWFYKYANGRCHTPSINVAWQLHDVGDAEGISDIISGFSKDNIRARCVSSTSGWFVVI